MFFNVLLGLIFELFIIKLVLWDLICVIIVVLFLIVWELYINEILFFLVSVIVILLLEIDCIIVEVKGIFI